MRLIKAFFRRITKDLKQKELLPLKILFFVHASTLFVLYPYLTIHMRELGINVEETAIMSAVTPVVAIVMPPLAGMVADKIGNFRLLLSIFSAMGGAAALLLLLVPVGRVTVTFPPRADLAVGCPAREPLAIAAQYPCEPIHPYAFDVDMRMEVCGIACDWPPENDSMTLSDAVSYVVKVRSPKEETTEVFRYPVTPKDLPRDSSVLDQNSKRIIHNSLRYKTSIRRISHKLLFFPTDGMYGFNCQSVVENSTRVLCAFGQNHTLNETEKETDIKQLHFRTKVLPISENSDQEVMALSVKTEKRFIKMFSVKGLAEAEINTANMTKEELHDVQFLDAACSNYYAEQEQDISVELMFEQKPLEEGKVKRSPDLMTMSVTSCTPRCIASTPRQGLCSNLKEEVELDASLTFWSYMAVRVFIGIIGGTAFAMFEGAVIAILREHEADYGLQRIYGSIGGMISSPLSGMMIDYASRGKGYTDFRPAFYLYAVLKMLSGFLMMTINLEFKSPATNLIKDVVMVLRNAEIVALFVACFVLGSIWGYIESFLFWLLQDLGGSRSLMGVTITVGGIAGIPLLVLSGPIIDRIGHANVLFIGFIFYAIRLVGYSLIYNPWMCLIFEALEGVTSSLAFTAAVTYAARLSTTTTDTSIQGLLGGLYYGVGKGAGSLVGGYLMKAFGTRPTYQIFAGAAVITGCTYYLFNKLYLMKRPRREANDICKKSSKIKSAEVIDTTLMKGNEKMPLKDNKTNFYSESVPTKNGVSTICQINDERDDKTIFTRESSRAQLTQDGDDAATRGLDNPTYEETEVPASDAGGKRPSGGSAVEMDRVDGEKINILDKNRKNNEK